MKSTKLFAALFTFSLLVAGAFAQGNSVSGIVTDKTTGKPAVGDTVAVVDVQQAMSEVAHATTDAKGHYTVQLPGSGPYLIRVTHQGAGYFIAAPQQAGQSGDIPVYDVAQKAQGVYLEADVIEVESDNGQLRVDERFFVHNTSSPPTTQWSPKSFEIQLPTDATTTDVSAQRPGGLPTSIKLDPDGPKGHYSFNFPIQPDDGDKDTMFQVGYTVPYSSNKYAFKIQESLSADNVAVLMPKSMSFGSSSGATFSAVNADPGVLTYLAKSVGPGKTIEFTVSGTGSIPRDQQGGTQAGGDASAAQSATATPGSTPGGGIGEPINTPDPLSKYKWWILGGLGLLLVAAAAFLLRRPEGAVMATASGAAALPPGGAMPAHSATVYAAPSTPAAKNAALLNVLKEELFSIESDKLSGAITPAEYAETKAALETVLKRALKKS
jgi:hypothetical protein